MIARFNRFAHSAGPGVEKDVGKLLSDLRGKWVPGGLTINVFGSPGVEFRPPGGPKWPSGGLLGPLGRQVGHRRALWAEKGESEIVKKFTCRARGASRKVLGSFFNFQGGHFGGSLLKAPQTLDFE